MNTPAPQPMDLLPASQPSQPVTSPRWACQAEPHPLAARLHALLCAPSTSDSSSVSSEFLGPSCHLSLRLLSIAVTRWLRKLSPGTLEQMCKNCCITGCVYLQNGELFSEGSVVHQQFMKNSRSSTAFSNCYRQCTIMYRVFPLHFPNY